MRMTHVNKGVAGPDSQTEGLGGGAVEAPKKNLDFLIRSDPLPLPVVCVAMGFTLSPISSSTGNPG